MTRDDSATDNIPCDDPQRSLREETLYTKNRWELTFDAVPDLIAIIDNQFRIVQVNKAMADRIGISPSEVVGLKCHDIVHHTSIPPDICPHRLLIQDGIARTIEIHDENLNGDFLLTVAPIRDKSCILGSVHVLRDITAQKRAQIALKESEERYHTLFDNMIEGLAYCQMIYDDQGRPQDFIYLSVNAAFERIIGVKAIPHKRVTEVFPGIREAYPQLFEIYGRVAASGTSESFEIEFSPIGKWLYISVYSPARNYFVAVFQDITERKLAEENLRQFQIFIESAFDSILTIRKRDGIILNANAMALKTYGYSLDEIRRMTIFDLRPFDTHSTVQIQMGAAANEGIRFEAVHRKKDGTLFPVDVSSSGIVLDNELLLFSIIRDITQRKRLEEAVELARKKLGILSSITRHDILNQLTALRSYLFLYHEQCPSDEKIQEYFGQMDKIASAIERQIEFTRYYQDIGIKAPQWQNVHNIATSTAVSGAFVGIAFKIETKTLEIYADMLLEKVFLNLYDNAVRHGGHVTEIRISFVSTQSEGILVIEDNGVGISAQDKEHIFERGFGKHTGFGLFLIREILAITGMTIKETGEPGKGARFEIVVPEGAYRFTHDSSSIHAI